MTDRKETPQLSILIALDHELLDPRGWFEALCNQTLPSDDYEVIIVDPSRDTDHESAMIKFREQGWIASNIGYHRTERGGRAFALNRGLDLAKGDLIAFLGDDCQPPRNFAEAHLRFHCLNPEMEAVAVGIALIPTELRTRFSDWLEKTGRLFGVPFDPGMTEVQEDFFYVANASVKRELLDRAGRFNEGFANHAWDDFELGQRLRAAGMKAVLLSEAPVQHLHQIDLADREYAMRLAGAAAKVYASIYPGPHEWSKKVEATRLNYWFRTTAARARTMLNRQDDALRDWWDCRLDAAFAKGYREGFTE